MRAVYKFPLSFAGGEQTVEMPRYAKVLHVEAQHGRPTIWALVNPDQPLVPRLFRVVGTGHAEVADGDLYLGTAQLGRAPSDLVLHVFAVGGAQ